MRAKFLAGTVLLVAICQFSTITKALESTSQESVLQSSSQKVELTIAEALEKQMKQGGKERQSEKQAAKARMQNMAVKSLEQMLALDSSKTDIFEAQNSNQGRQAIAKGNQLMKKFSGKIQKTLAQTMGEGEESKKELERTKKFENMAQRGQTRMLQHSKNQKDHNQVFLKLMQKNHVFDSAMGSEIVGGGADQVQAQLDQVEQQTTESAPQVSEAVHDLKANSTLVQSGEIEEENSEDQVSIEQQEDQQAQEDTISEQEEESDNDSDSDEESTEETEEDQQEKKQKNKKKAEQKKKENKKKSKGKSEQKEAVVAASLPTAPPKSLAQISSFKSKHMSLYKQEKHYLKERMACKEQCNLEKIDSSTSSPTLNASCPSSCSAHEIYTKLSKKSRKSNEIRAQMKKQIEQSDEVMSYETDKSRLKEVEDEMAKLKEIEKPL